MQALDGSWLIGPDPGNVGWEERWFADRPTSEAQPAIVPGVIQQTYPGYHGVAWYWRSFVAAPPARAGDRYHLRFSAVDYLADVWVNGVHVGGHEGGDTPFVLDVTDVLRPGRDNQLAVRVLNPTNEPTDGFTLGQTPHRNKIVPYVTGHAYNSGGITNSVELLYVPPVHVAVLYVRPDPGTGLIRLSAAIQNDTGQALEGQLAISLAPAAGGRTFETTVHAGTFAPGHSVREMEVSVAGPRLWSVQDPYLYRATVHMRAAGEGAAEWHDEQTVRCGFRDFRFEDGYFRLNGDRIFLRSAHTGNEYPMGLCVPQNPDFLRRDFYYAKSMGFNMVRFIAGLAFPAQLDLCDELGLMVYEESLAAWCLDDSPTMAERFDRSTVEMVHRDRNHPSVVIWGMLNETYDGPVFRHAVEALSVVRALDDSRMVLLNSGRWDRRYSVGSISNPGSTDWEPLLGTDGSDPPKDLPNNHGYLAGAGDAHYYPRIPLTAEAIQFFRTLGEGTKPVFLSEHGNGGQVDALRLIRLYEQAGAREDLQDYVLYRSEAEKYLTDWDHFGMDEIFASPADLMRESQKIQSELRLVGLNAIRANPNLVGYSLTGLVDQGRTAEGLWTTFRELKPGMTEAIREGWEPLRWCLFAEPVHGYRGRSFRIEAILANEDVLLPGEYTVRLRVVGPDGVVLERAEVVTVPSGVGTNEPPFAIPVFCEEAVVEGRAGRYEVVVSFEHGAAPAGGRTHFYVADPADLPQADTELTLFGDQGLLAPWLEKRGIQWRCFDAPEPGRCEIVLVSGLGGPPGDGPAFRKLAKRIAQGGVAVFLAPKALARGNDRLAWLPLTQKGALRATKGWAAGRDDFAKAHPIFNGLPAGGLLDPTFYRDLIPEETFDGQSEPDEVVAGSFAVGSYQPGGYNAGTHITVHSFGAGAFVLNSLPILEHLDSHPAADRLLLNMVLYGRELVAADPAPLPSDFGAHLAAIGYM